MLDKKYLNAIHEGQVARFLSVVLSSPSDLDLNELFLGSEYETDFFLIVSNIFDIKVFITSLVHESVGIFKILRWCDSGASQDLRYFR